MDMARPHAPRPVRSPSVAEARDRLTRVIREAEHGARIEITRHGRPVAVLLSRSHHEELSARRASFREAICAFRASVDWSLVPEDPLPVEGLRDASPGRGALPA